MEKYGDEGFIRLLREGQEESRNKDIKKGSVFAGDYELIFKEREIIKGRLWMWMPKEFTILNKEMARIKYPNENRPDIIYTNPQTTVNISISYKKDKMMAGQESEVRDSILEVVQSMYPGAIIDADAAESDESQAAWFDFVTPAIDAQIYNLMFFTSLRGKLLQGSCNCLSQDQNDWKGLFVQMLKTIRMA